MNTLIIGIVFNLNDKQIIPFLKSARQYYSGAICIITSETNNQILDVYKKYDVYVHYTNLSNDRHVAFKQRLVDINYLLKTKYSDIDRVFFTDIRDVYFFGDIFSYPFSSNITFFAEPHLIGDCTINSRWYEMTYNADELNKVKNNYIICNGTILSTKDSMISYTELVLDQINTNVYVTDQPNTNYLVYNNKINNYTVSHHGKGPIGTFAHDANMNHCVLSNHKVYNKSDGSDVLVVHQYDRCPVLNEYIFNHCFFELTSSNKEMYQLCTELFNSDKQLIKFREYIKDNKFGFGDNEHYVMWDKLVHNLHSNFKFIEIGVYKGQVLALVSYFAKKYNIKCQIYGVTPLFNLGDKYGEYDEVNYLECIKLVHKTFDVNFNENQIIKGISTDDCIINTIKSLGGFDCIYIDGGHDYNTVKSDILLGKQICNKNGFIIMDDSSTFIEFDDLDVFKGHYEVSLATNDHLANDDNFIEKSCIGHNRIFQKSV